MVERGTGGTERTIVCPFLAFGDDREYRGSVPDHRHRCFAETPAAPRALAHQAAYCLTASFTACPTFVDWARRESAPARDEPAVRPRREPPGSPRFTGREPAGPAAEPPTWSGRDASWDAPPPWGTAAATLGEPAGAPLGEAASFEELSDVVLPRRAPAPIAADGEPATPEAERPPEFLAGRSASRYAPPRPPAFDDVDEVLAGGAVEGVEAEVPDEDEPGAPARAADFRPPGPANRRAPVGYAGLAGGGRTRRERSVDPDAPAWERPRRFEAYPTIRTRALLPAIPRPLAIALVVLVAGVGLFFAPALLRGFLGGGTTPSPSPTATAAVTAKPTPTKAAAPTPLVYVVKSGDLLSKIASKYHVTVDQILAANPSIKDANLIKPGDRITIPLPLPSEVVDNGGAITPAP
jgi:LysM repeat protein